MSKLNTSYTLFAMNDPILACQSIIETVRLQLGHGYIDICRNAGCCQMRLACAW